MSGRLVSIIVSYTILASVLSSCGGGGSGPTGGGGGGDGSGLSISQLAPSSVMVGISQGQVTIYGQGFTQQSLVFIDGQQAPVTTFTDSGTLQAEIDPLFTDTAGTHQFAVHNGSSASNNSPFTIYAPQQGPFVMQAVPGFLVGENLSDPPFIIAADVNGDGLADVVMQGPGLSNSASIAILSGQKNGTLSEPVYVPVPTRPPISPSVTSMAMARSIWSRSQIFPDQASSASAPCWAMVTAIFRLQSCSRLFLETFPHKQPWPISMEMERPTCCWRFEKRPAT